MSVRRVFCAVVAAAGLVALSACSEGSSDPAPSSQPPAAKAALTDAAFPTYRDTSDELAQGARLFSSQRCAECHSDGGVILGAGNGNIDVIATAIRDGRPNGMPAYRGKLTDAQIWQIAAFVKALDTHGDRAQVGRGFSPAAAP